MKTLKTLIASAAILFTSLTSTAQTADEIITKYFENIGGKEKLSKVNSFKMSMVTNYNGMEIPVEVFNDKTGKMYVKINFQGKEITQIAFDGKTGWSTNFMTMKAEKLDSETTENMLSQIKDFPDPFLNYKEKGFKVEFLGKETKEGTECFKIKLTKDPITVAGKKEENVTFYYFDTENYVPIMTEAEIKEGPSKGQISTSTMGDYQEVDGLFFPFTMNQGGQAMTVKKILINPTVDAKEFEMKTE
ncbi:outer membrane lipoprotein-sorting protein [Flavobacterium difficile]|uniref:Outer membrane lipoprotein-sorting protein n=1 Tax=Flavobacterium difficile TaxID=2709659 RepID=A0ABX0I839_9FLAO|nr:outer membrane lipoprotein-sorting protein [Flavobacterium difficile]NHM01887.1 outer membrane lipoprotein-sorting protein [Flavobacterium difficile]